MGRLQALEALCLGIIGKRALWSALQAMPETPATWPRVDFDRLLHRAEEQLRRTEVERLKIARRALRPTHTMAEYSYPGVYVEETGGGVKPIDGVSTGTSCRPDFRITIEFNGMVVGKFTEVSGLKTEIEIGGCREGRERQEAARKGGSVRKFPTITLKRGSTSSRELWEWHQSVVDGKPAPRNGSIVLYDEARQAALRWQFSNGLPVKVTGPGLHASGNEVAIEAIEIAHEGLELVPSPCPPCTQP